MNNQLIKSNFDFGYKKWKLDPIYAKLTLEYEKGDILDIGCATCQMYEFLKRNGWKGKYYGIDIQKYEGYAYPNKVNLIIGDATQLDFPEVDTILLYNILEHVNDPISLLKKSLDSSKKNVLIHIPKRNEKLWKHGLAEFHQLDKTHMHCGFSKAEIYNIVSNSGGSIKKYNETDAKNAIIGINLWDNIIPKLTFILLNKTFSSKTFYENIWLEVVKK
ncbi:methyltransferase domain-containing protein [Methanobacterium sp.]|jgi:SAM-dependent methyltransferase|uniref:class I SAM-dependent methyltransferase n=1 Tax=Methanobacterium sp. TaxID=2164 RepID=UPI00315938BB